MMGSAGFGGHSAFVLYSYGHGLTVRISAHDPDRIELLVRGPVTPNSTWN